MLGNSTRGLNQMHLRCIYLGAILPIATYGSVAFWDGKSTTIRNALEHMQNKALRMITGAFKTTPIRALEVEASIPPIDITLNYLIERYAKHTLKLTPHNPVISRIPEHCRHLSHNSPSPPPPPLPCFPSPPKHIVAAYLIKRREEQIRNETSTRLIQMAKYIPTQAEHIDPYAETPWHRSELDPDICN